MDTGVNLLILILIHQLLFRASFLALILVLLYCIEEGHLGRKPRRRGITYSIVRRIPHQVTYLDKLLNTGDVNVKNLLRVDRNSFMKLCYLLHDVGGLRESKYVTLSAQVAMFLDVLAHHTKNRKVGSHFVRSGETGSRYFQRVLLAVLKCHSVLIAQPEPIGPDDLDPMWKYFPGCIGALDGTFVQVQVPVVDKPRYRTRKGVVAMNVLCCCDRYGKFTYVLPGWEGTAADSRVLKDAFIRAKGFRIPTGCYYLVDGGYTNGEGFLAPYRGVRYHLKEWENSNRAPQNYEEYFNLKHAKARNVIEKSFGGLKKRWAILRKNSYFPIKTHKHIVMCCVILHNFIRREMLNSHLDEDWPEEPRDDGNDSGYVDVVQPTVAWTNFRDTLAQKMYNEWRATRRHR